MDLRESVMTAWQEGKTQAWIADTYALSVSTIKRYISRFRQQGSVLPTIQGREQPLIKDSQATAVQAMAHEQPDATLAVYCALRKDRTAQTDRHPTTNP